jgi:hypothetical protein
MLPSSTGVVGQGLYPLIFILLANIQTLYHVFLTLLRARPLTERRTSTTFYVALPPAATLRTIILLPDDNMIDAAL